VVCFFFCWHVFGHRSFTTVFFFFFRPAGATTFVTAVSPLNLGTLFWHLQVPPIIPLNLIFLGIDIPLSFQSVFLSFFSAAVNTPPTQKAPLKLVACSLGSALFCLYFHTRPENFLNGYCPFFSPSFCFHLPCSPVIMFVIHSIFCHRF